MDNERNERTADSFGLQQMLGTLITLMDVLARILKANDAHYHHLASALKGMAAMANSVYDEGSRNSFAKSFKVSENDLFTLNDSLISASMGLINMSGADESFGYGSDEKFMDKWDRLVERICEVYRDIQDMTERQFDEREQGNDKVTELDIEVQSR